MADTYKDKPDKYRKEDIKDSRKPREGRRFESTKGRKNKPIINNISDYYESYDTRQYLNVYTILLNG